MSAAPSLGATENAYFDARCGWTRGGGPAPAAAAVDDVELLDNALLDDALLDDEEDDVELLDDGVDDAAAERDAVGGLAAIPAALP